MDGKLRTHLNIAAGRVPQEMSRTIRDHLRQAGVYPPSMTAISYVLAAAGLAPEEKEPEMAAAVTNTNVYRTADNRGRIVLDGFKVGVAHIIERVGNEVRIKPTNDIGIKVRANWDRARHYTYVTSLQVQVGDWVRLPDSGYGEWVGQVTEIGRTDWTGNTKRILGVIEPHAVPAARSQTRTRVDGDLYGADGGY